MDNINKLRQQFTSARFERGLRLSKSSDIEIVDVTELETTNGVAFEVIAGIEGNFDYYEVDINLDSDFEITYARCTCEDFRSNYGTLKCKHIAAVAIKAIPLIENHPEYLYKNVGIDQDLIELVGETDLFEMYNFNEQMKIQPILTFDTENSNLRFKVGNDKMYVIKSIDVFCQQIEINARFSYGKNLEFVHDIQYFDEKSKNIIKFLMEQNQIERETIVYNYYQGYTTKGTGLGQYLKLSSDQLIQFMKINNDSAINVITPKSEAIEMQVQKVNFLESNVVINHKVLDDDYTIDLKYTTPNDSITQVTKNHMIMVHDRKILLADEKTTKLYHYLSHNATQRGKSMTKTIKNESAKYFNEKVVPSLKEHFNVTEKNIKVKEIDYIQTTYEFYFDYKDQRVISNVKIIYGEEVYHILDLEYHHGAQFDLIRKVFYYYYHELIDEIKEDGTIIFKDDQDLILKFIHGPLKLLENYGEVFVTDKFEKMNVIRKVKIEAKVSLESNLLNLKLDLDDIDLKEMLDVFQSFKKKAKFHRLKDGSMIMMDDPNIHQLMELKNGLGIADKQFIQGNMEVPGYRALYIDQLFQQTQTDLYEKNSYLEDLINGFDHYHHQVNYPSSLKNILRDYQKEGVAWLSLLDHYQFGGILADDMGLGKTLQVITFLLLKKEANLLNKALVVTPASLLYNWKVEFEKFAPQLKVLIIDGNSETRLEKYQEIDDCDIIVISYDLLRRDITTFENIKFDYQIIDEAQYIKNNSALLTKAVKLIQANRKFALTGTPIENRLSELWSIFDFVMPGYLFSYDKFKKELEKPIVLQGNQDDMQRLRNLVSPFILRRIKANVLKELPPKIEEVIYAKMSKEQENVYQAQALHMKKMLLSKDEAEFNTSKIKILAELTRLRQLCCDPNLVLENYKGDSTKLEATMEIIHQAIDGGHKILLFSQFTSMLDILQQRLNQDNIETYRIDGSVP